MDLGKWGQFCYASAQEHRFQTHGKNTWSIGLHTKLNASLHGVQLAHHRYNCMGIAPDTIAIIGAAQYVDILFRLDTKLNSTEENRLGHRKRVSN